MHFGLPDVPELYRIYNGWLNGNCSNLSSRPSPVARNSTRVVLGVHSQLCIHFDYYRGTHVLANCDLRAAPDTALGSRMAFCKLRFERSCITSLTLGIRSTTLPKYWTSVSAKMNFGCICLYLSRMPWVPMSVAVVENMAPTLAVARASTTAVMSLATIAALDEHMKYAMMTNANLRLCHQFAARWLS